MQAVSVTPVVGLPQVNGWSQVIDHLFDGVHLVATVAVQGEKASSVGRDIVSMVLDQEPDSAQHVYQFLEYLVEFTHKQGCELSLTLGLLSQGRCIVSSRYGTVWLKRGKKIGALVEAETEIALIEGSAHDDDTFIFSTQSARQFLPTVELQFEQGFDVDGVITSIVPAVHSLGNSSLNALAFVTAGKRLGDEKFTSPVQPTQRYVSPRESTEVEEAAAVANPYFVEPEQSEAPTEVAASTQKSSSNLVTKGASFIRATYKNVSRLFSQKTYVGGQLSQQKLVWWLSLVTAIVIGIGVGLYYILHLRSERAFAANLIAPYVQSIEQAQVTALNDPLSARQALEATAARLVALQAEYQNSGRSQVLTAVNETLTTAQTAQQAISGLDKFTDLPIFYDLRLASSDFVTSLATVQGQTALFIDSQKKRAIALNLNSKQVTQIDLQSLEPVTSVSVLEDEAIVLLATGLYQVNLSADTKQVSELKEVGDSNRAATYVSSFGSYVYVFNPEKRNVYRYAATETGYSDPIGWLQSPLGVPFESVRSMMIDGDLWISTQTGEIKKFTSGKAAEYTLTGMAEPFNSPVFLFTQEATTNLYALEPEKKRLVILSKEGQFIREVRSDSFASATTLVVSEAVGKAFAVSGSIVYEVGL